METDGSVGTPGSEELWAMFKWWANEMNGRHERIRRKLALFSKLGIIVDCYAQSMMPGKRWHIIPFGSSERAYTTSQIEDFILGVETALNWKDHQPSMQEQINA